MILLYMYSYNLIESEQQTKADCVSSYNSGFILPFFPIDPRYYSKTANTVFFSKLKNVVLMRYCI
jgi:hypothetical protein